MRDVGDVRLLYPDENSEWGRRFGFHDLLGNTEHRKTGSPAMLFDSRISPKLVESSGLRLLVGAQKHLSASDNCNRGKQVRLIEDNTQWQV